LKNSDGTHDSFDLVPSTTDCAVAGVIVSTTCLLNEAEVGVVCCPLDDLISADVVGQHVGGVVRGDWVGMGKEGRRGLEIPV
jgi:hypothetical protein